MTADDYAKLIPPEARIAALRAYSKAERDNRKLKDCLNAACAAMLAAWPNVYTVPRGFPATDIILPLPQETSNDR